MAQETFSDRLRQAMSDRDVRQSDVIRASEMFGKKLGKSQMSQYVSGKTIPRRDVAELLARILEVDVTWLLAGDADHVGGEAHALVLMLVERIQEVLPGHGVVGSRVFGRQA